MNDQPIRELFERVTRAYRDADYRLVASLCDPVSLLVFKRSSVERVASFRTSDWSVEEMMRGNPNMPREVAEFNIAQWRKNREEQHPLRFDFPRIASLEDLRVLDPVDVFAEWLYARSPEHAFHSAVARGDVPAQEMDFLSATTGMGPTFELCCVIPASERMAEIVFRRGIELDGNELSDDELEAEDPELAALLSQLTEEERQLQRDQALWPLDFAQCRAQPDGSWKMIADDRFLNRQGGQWFYGWGSS
jgi:hypothetical protein